jgi:membrane fusion protein, multidrug efflux system
MSLNIKRGLIMLAVVGIVFGLIFGYQIFGGIMMRKYMAAGALPPQTVSTVSAKFEEWQPTISAVGTLRAVKGADLSTEVAGIVDEILFESGEGVKAGTVLVRLRNEDEEARLRSLETTAQLAASTYERNRKQFEAKAISQAALDVDAANVKNTQAAVAQQRATLNKKIVRAPFDGELGVRRIDIGQYINPGDAIVTLQALDPIYVDFYLPADDASRVKTGLKVIASAAATGRQLEGQISAINTKVDLNTRNVLIRATLPNPKRDVLPGTSVRIEIETGAPLRYLTLPQTAISFNPYGDTVYLAVEKAGKDKGKRQLQAQQQIVITGPRRGDQVAVFDGVKEGDVVVSAGQMKLQNGTPLIVNNSIVPPAEPNPKPSEG